jgi:CBS domain-containing membrane protein
MTTTERVVALMGALAGIAITAVLVQLLGSDPRLPLIIAPMGASAVLVFAVPASPLAQPWSVFGGNTVSALAGVAAMQLIPHPVVAAAVAVAGAIGLMSLARCLHPPGGAVALTAVVGGPAIHALGFSFALMPVALSSLFLVGVGIVFNNGLRRSYPHVAAPAVVPPVTAPTRALPPLDVSSVTRADVESALAALDERLDVDVEDVEALVHAVVAAAGARIAAHHGAGATV